MEVAETAEKEPTKTTEQKQIGNYWSKYSRRASIVALATQIAVSITAGAALLVGGASYQDPLFWMAVLSIFIIGSILNLYVINVLLTPHRDIVNVIKSAHGEKLTEPLANPNTPRYERSGFTPVLQAVYDIAAHKQDPEDEAKSKSSDNIKSLETAMRQINTGVIIMDADGKILHANPAAPTSDCKDGGKKLDLLFDQNDGLDKWLTECRDKAIHSTRTWMRVPDKIVGDENRRIFNVTANYEKGSAAEVVLVCFDSSDIYQAEDNDLDFVAFAAHELRGPITVIRGYLDVLDMELSDQIAPDQQELLKRLIVSANRLTGYINNILNTSKYDRRHLVLHLGEESISGIYDIISDDMSMRAAAQNRLLSVNLPDDLPTVAADRSSISEVISNLIDNAIKYSNEGGAIAVSAMAKDGFVEVSVKDNGIGIPANIIGNLFHKFYRSHRSRETVGGTGIGLYICKAIVESHGGKIGVISAEGQGATFTFSLPIYSTIADKLQANDHTNAGLIKSGEGWIKNHAKYTS